MTSKAYFTVSYQLDLADDSRLTTNSSRDFTIGLEID
jgi:hypothetical protein